MMPSTSSMPYHHNQGSYMPIWSGRVRVTPIIAALMFLFDQLHQSIWTYCPRLVMFEFRVIVFTSASVLT